MATYDVCLYVSLVSLLLFYCTLIVIRDNQISFLCNKRTRHDLFLGLLRDCTNFLLDYKNEALQYIISGKKLNHVKAMVTVNTEEYLCIKSS